RGVGSQSPHLLDEAWIVDPPLSWRQHRDPPPASEGGAGGQQRSVFRRGGGVQVADAPQTPSRQRPWQTQWRGCVTRRVDDCGDLDVLAGGGGLQARREQGHAARQVRVDEEEQPQGASTHRAAPFPIQIRFISAATSRAASPGGSSSASPTDRTGSTPRTEPVRNASPAAISSATVSAC